MQGRKITLYLWMVSTAISTAAYAQDGAVAGADTGTSADAAGRADSGGIEDIVVTAQRRAESLQSVPIAVTAVSAAAIEQGGVRDTNDIQRLTPGLVMNTFRSTVTPYLRGVGTQNTAAGEEGSIATYVDGVYISAMSATTFGLANIERVEVLKGPQGTLFGRNATGGLLHIITKDPSFTPLVQAQIGYANYDTISGNAYATGGLSEKIAMDVSGYFSRQGKGWGRNISGIAGLDGREVNYTREWSARSKLLFQANDSVRVTLAGDYTYRDSDVGITRAIRPGSSITCRTQQICDIIAADPRTAAYGNQPRTVPFVEGSNGGVSVGGVPANGTVARGSIYDTQGNLPRFGKVKQYGGSLKVEFDIATGATLTSTTGYRHALNTQNFDQDGGQLQLVDAIFTERTQTIQQELLLVGSAGSLDYTAGLFYFHAKAGNRPLSFNSQTTNSVNGFDRYSQLHTDSYAGFAQGTYHVTDTTGITAGVRYTIDKRDIFGYNFNRANASNPVAAPIGSIVPDGAIAGVVGPRSQKRTFKKVTYRFALDQKLTDNVLAYVSYSRGFKSGVFNATSYEALPVRPETLDALEGGIKTDLLDRRLRLNLSAFYYKYRDIQLQRVQNGQTQNINAASAKTRGAEIEIIAAPPVATGNLTFSFNASYLHARFGQFANMPILVPRINPATNLPTGIYGNITVTGTTNGLTLPRAPSFTASVAADYSVPIGSGELGFNINYYLNSGYYGDVDNRVEQPSYGVLNGQISYTAPDDRWRVTGFVRNITDERYFNQLSNSGLGDQVTGGAPRTYGVTFGVKIGG